MLQNILILLVGFIVLIKASDIFVDAISSIATHFNMTKMTIALTVAAFGTCAPELAISFNSIINGSGDIALSNVIGSNVVNILLIIGIASICFPIKVKSVTVKKELPILLAITSIFSLAMLGNFSNNASEIILKRSDGMLFVIFFLVFILYIISIIRMKSGSQAKDKAKFDIKTSITLTICCIILIILASDLVVGNAKIIAEYLNISNKIITMTVVVIGTSLPELTMTIIAVKKGEFDIAIGNIIGTNIFNIGIVLGLPIVLFGGFTSSQFNLIDIFTIFIAALLLYFACRNDRVITKREGLLMVGVFLIYYAYLFVA